MNENINYTGVSQNQRQENVFLEDVSNIQRFRISQKPKSEDIQEDGYLYKNNLLGNQRLWARTKSLYTQSTPLRKPSFEGRENTPAVGT